MPPTNQDRIKYFNQKNAFDFIAVFAIVPITGQGRSKSLHFYFLDAAVEGNDAGDQALTDQLYLPGSLFFTLYQRVSRRHESISQDMFPQYPINSITNGVPSLSVLDDWWIEGHVEGVTGWSVGDSWKAESDPGGEISSLYGKLESVILPMFYQQPHKYAEVMRSAIALNGSFFNAQRMMFQYLQNAYADKENH